MPTRESPYAASTRGLRAQVDGAMRAGASLDEVDAGVIRGHRLDEDSAAALWLYARSWEHGRYGYQARQAGLARAARQVLVAGTD